MEDAATKQMQMPRVMLLAV